MTHLHHFSFVLSSCSVEPFVSPCIRLSCDFYDDMPAARVFVYHRNRLHSKHQRIIQFVTHSVSRCICSSQVGSVCQQHGTLSPLTWIITQTPTVYVQLPPQGGAAKWDSTALQVAPSRCLVHLEPSATSQVFGHWLALMSLLTQPVISIQQCFFQPNKLFLTRILYTTLKYMVLYSPVLQIL